MEENILKLITDVEIGNEHQNREDVLGFSTYATVLTKVLNGTDSNLTIGIYGEWGTGKTSLLRLIQEKLMLSKNILTIWYNAWLYEREEHPFLSLTATICKSLVENKDYTLPEPKKNKLIKILKAIACGIEVSPKFDIGAELGITIKPKDIIEKIEETKIDNILEKSIYFNTFELLNSYELEKDKKIVVLIDDLDRCLPDNALKLLESIKLILNHPNFQFVFAVSKDVLEGFLTHKFKSEYGASEDIAKKYLDKIVQVPFYLPKSHKNINKFIESLSTYFTHRNEINDSLIEIIIECLEFNPRSIIRFLNSSLIDKEISTLNNPKLTIPFSTLIISRLLETKWYGVYIKLINDDELCKHLSEITKDNLPLDLNTCIGNEVEIYNLLNNDVVFTKLFFNHFFHSWLESIELRSIVSKINFSTELHLDSLKFIYDAFLFYDARNRDIVLSYQDLLLREKCSLNNNPVKSVMTSSISFTDEEIKSKNLLVFLNKRVKSEYIKSINGIGRKFLQQKRNIIIIELEDVTQCNSLEKIDSIVRIKHGGYSTESIVSQICKHL